MKVFSHLCFAALLALAFAPAQAREGAPFVPAASAASSAAASAAAPAISVVGDDGQAVQLAAAPQRIVSLLPSLTET